VDRVIGLLTALLRLALLRLDLLRLAILRLVLRGDTSLLGGRQVRRMSKDLVFRLVRWIV
jgi:hypothetical protein